MAVSAQASTEPLPSRRCAPQVSRVPSGEEAGSLIGPGGHVHRAGGLGHLGGLGNQGGGVRVQPQLPLVVPAPDPQGAVFQDGHGVAGSRGHGQHGTVQGDLDGLGLQHLSGLAGAQLAVDVAPPIQRVPSVRRAAAW